MPMTAMHAEAGVLDLTAEPLGGSLQWGDIHRARPRAPLRCRECGHGLQAKRSPRGLRFFAHDPGAPACSLAGESLAHHLLKQELASAVRAAGWHAELEVPGDGWRADVLATSPDGSRRMAWEAQLSPIDLEAIEGRTARLHASGVRVCWVAHRPQTWIGHVPSVVIDTSTSSDVVEHQADHDQLERGIRREVAVIDGLGTYHLSWCPHRGCCQHLPWRYGVPEPCPGHGGWTTPRAAISLSRFVAGVLRGSVVLHRCSPGASQPLLVDGAGTVSVWTTHPHLRKAQEHAEGIRTHEEWIAREERRRRGGDRPYDAAGHQKNYEAKMRRQQSLLGPAVRYLEKNAGGGVSKSGRHPDAFWAGGIPLRSHGRVRGVVSPVLSRMKPEIIRRLGGVVVFVADEREKALLISQIGENQRIVVLATDPPPAS